MTADHGQAAHAPVEPRQDFPLETFSYLEEQLRKVRIYVMRLAGKKSLDEHAEGEVYTVGKSHVDSALRELIPNIAELAKVPDAGRIPAPKDSHAADVADRKSERGPRT